MSYIGSFKTLFLVDAFVFMFDTEQSLDTFIHYEQKHFKIYISPFNLISLSSETVKRRGKTKHKRLNIPWMERKMSTSNVRLTLFYDAQTI